MINSYAGVGETGQAAFGKENAESCSPRDVVGGPKTIEYWEWSSRVSS